MTKLTRELHTIDGKTLRTIDDAKRYAVALPAQYATRLQWQHVARLMLDKASAAAITDQVEKALFLDMRLKLK